MHHPPVHTTTTPQPGRGAMAATAAVTAVATLLLAGAGVLGWTAVSSAGGDIRLARPTGSESVDGNDGGDGTGGGGWSDDVAADDVEADGVDTTGDLGEDEIGWDEAWDEAWDGDDAEGTWDDTAGWDETGTPDDTSGWDETGSWEDEPAWDETGSWEDGTGSWEGEPGDDADDVAVDPSPDGTTSPHDDPAEVPPTVPGPRQDPPVLPGEGVAALDPPTSVRATIVPADETTSPPDATTARSIRVEWTAPASGSPEWYAVVCRAVPDDTRTDETGADETGADETVDRGERWFASALVPGGVPRVDLGPVAPAGSYACAVATMSGERRSAWLVTPPVPATPTAPVEPDGAACPTTSVATSVPPAPSTSTAAPASVRRLRCR